MTAGQDIAEGGIICSFKGELVEKKNNTYRSVMYCAQHNKNADQILGAGFFVNDGPPNCFMTDIKNYRGIPQFRVLEACRPIQKGEFLHICYGADHDLRVGMYGVSDQPYAEVVNYCKKIIFTPIRR